MFYTSFLLIIYFKPFLLIYLFNIEGFDLANNPNRLLMNVTALMALIGTMRKPGKIWPRGFFFSNNL